MVMATVMMAMTTMTMTTTLGSNVSADIEVDRHQCLLPAATTMQQPQQWLNIAIQNDWQQATMTYRLMDSKSATTDDAIRSNPVDSTEQSAVRDGGEE
jgi:hypothetical protein